MDSRPQAQFSADVAVIGGGVIGHSIAWQARCSGRSVVVIDAVPGSGASWAAAGMLAPVSELHYQEENLLGLTLESAAQWPQFARDVTAVGGPVGYRDEPTLAVGVDAADRRALLDLRTVQHQHGLSVEPLSIRQVREREPLLSPAISCALDTAADHQVDPRLLLASLRRALAQHDPSGTSGTAGTGTTVAGAEDGFAVPHHASDLVWAADAVVGVRLAGGGTVYAKETVLANGLHAASMGQLPAGLNLPVRPVHGDILRLHVPAHLRPLLRTTVRGLVRGVPVYIVPRDDGTVVIGATQREDGGAPVSAGGVYQLLRDAQALVPAVAELELIETTARARPGTPDNAPLLGRVPSPATAIGHVPGLIIATGFFRHGVLLAPAAASICTGLMDGHMDSRWDVFSPARFSELSPAVPRKVEETV
ncbi:Hydrogen cyanide synthase subunit HcnC precursor [Arthrobacter ulcerisalmonis]|uniref:glycine oxidase n=1 Tax=Arthrobacter ulcerisalmonis TaxID=2483813 RepID=A0A3P5X6T4_9MICC|nr:glycine oxidase ThiO [Arthrobacter ulcerisalmonis]VDC27004.1 Hydrogen cyanide synthase subunit HcnC precursor [Arthrobacter ulcerisalmonis]